MAELRWNPFMKDWVMIASHRQDRPQMPKDWCPFCSGSGRVPDDYDVLKYDNDFPALSLTPQEPDPVGTDYFALRPAYGKCEVILYTPIHESSLCGLSMPHAEKLIDLWIDRYVVLSGTKGIKYVFIFENRGEAVGVTMPHPHGQIYAYPFLPKKIALEWEALTEYASSHAQKCLHCDHLAKELGFGDRIIYENNSFVLFLPFYSEYPFGVQITSKRHFPSIDHMNSNEKRDLASMILVATGSLDALFDTPFPYMMCFHNAPLAVNDSQRWHFHIEFFPPMRSADKQKFNASSETGAWAHCNTTSPEEKAAELRAACLKVLHKRGDIDVNR